MPVGVVIICRGGIEYLPSVEIDLTDEGDCPSKSTLLKSLAGILHEDKSAREALFLLGGGKERGATLARRAMSASSSCQRVASAASQGTEIGAATLTHISAWNLLG